MDVVRLPAFFEEAGDERSRHVSAADECDLH
jgi:hypothetical protein